MRLMKTLVLSLSLFAGFLQAQDFAQVIKEMRKEYEGSKTLQVVMEVSVYDSVHAPMPHYKQIVDVKREGTNYWYQFEENEMLLNEKYLVIVDKESKLISYSKRSVQMEAELQKTLVFNVDSVLKEYDAPLRLGKEGNVEHYVVNERRGAIEKIHFYIIPEQHLLKKLEYNYREGQFVSINFLAFDKNVVFPEDTFSESRYLIKMNNKVIPSRFFRQYELQYQ